MTDKRCYCGSEAGRTMDEGFVFCTNKRCPLHHGKTSVEAWNSRPLTIGEMLEEIKKKGPRKIDVGMLGNGIWYCKVEIGSLVVVKHAPTPDEAVRKAWEEVVGE